MAGDASGRSTRSARRRAVGLTGQMHGLVLLDAADRVLRPAILWNDQRTGAECAEIEERIGFERLVALTGNRALPGFTAPKLVWVRKHEPEVWAQAAHVLLPKDYVRLRLTGERAIDAAEASGTLLFDVAGRRWSGRGLRRRSRSRSSGCRPRTSRPRSAAPATSRRARSASASSGPGRCRSCSARRASSSRRSPATGPTRRRASTSSATPSRTRGRRWA